MELVDEKAGSVYTVSLHQYIILFDLDKMDMVLFKYSKFAPNDLIWIPMILLRWYEVNFQWYIILFDFDKINIVLFEFSIFSKALH